MRVHIKLKQKEWFVEYLDALIDGEIPPVELPFKKTGSAEQWGQRYCEAFFAHYGFHFQELKPGNELRNWLHDRFQFDEELDGFFELVALHFQLMQGLSTLFGRPAPKQRRIIEFGVLLAAMYGFRDVAADLGHELGELPETAIKFPRSTRKLLKRLTRHLDDMGSAWADSLYGATMKSAFRFADTQLLAELATDFFLKGGYDHLRLYELYLNRVDQKRILFESAISMAWSDGRISSEERRFLKHLIELANLPENISDELLDSLDQPPRPLPEIADEVQDEQTRRFIFRQVILTSMADGSQDDGELDMIDRLASRLDIEPDESDRIHADVLDYFEENRHIFDHSLLGTFNRFRSRITHRVTRIVKKNTDRIMTEVRQTKELSQLLVKAAGKENLSREEKKRVREQLLDIAKTVPALAIFVIPGGSLVFAVLCKVLPFNLLPSAFAEEGDEPTPEPSEA